MERRRLLQRLGTGLGSAVAVSLAGCTLDGDGPGDTGTPTVTPPPTETRTPTDEPTATRPPRTPTGPERYTQRGGGDGVAVVASDAFDADVAFHVAGDAVRAVEDDGEIRWTADGAREGDVAGAVVVGTDSLVVTWTGETRAYDAADGTERWRATRGCVGPPAVVEDTVVLADRQGRVVGRALSRDDERWTGALGATPTGLVSVAGRVAVATRGPGDSALVRALDPRDGSEQWQVHPGYEVTTPPVAVDGAAVVGVLNPEHELGDSAATASPTDGAASGAVVGCDDGSEAWTTGLPGRPVDLRAAGDRVFTVHDAFVFERLARVPHLSAVRPAGTTWTDQPVASGVTPVVTQGAVVVAGTQPSTSGPGEVPLLAGHATTDGTRWWEREESTTALAAAGETVVVGTESRVRVHDALSGTVRWEA
jgi:outer membrane protein assembly factor BamB